MVLYKSKYTEIIYDEQKSLIRQVFSEETDQMEIDDFKTEMNVFADFVLDKKAAFHLINSVNLKFGINPELQDWINNDLFVKFETIVEKVAFLMPIELVSLLSVEQTMDEENAKKYRVQYFNNEDEAIKWLLKN